MTATTQTTEATISARSRNLGYGWTTQRGDLGGGPMLLIPTGPGVTGGLANIELEMYRASRIIGDGGCYCDAMYVGGLTISGVWSPHRQFADLRGPGPGWEAWSIREIINALRAGDRLRVRLTSDEALQKEILIASEVAL